jgi:glycosyltransferase involved in cell wall biosynthesis
MKILALSSYPIEAAATRYRLFQFVEPLAGRGITMAVSPFIDTALFNKIHTAGGIVSKGLAMAGPVIQRAAQTFSAGKYDLLFVQREAMFFGPAFFEWVYQAAGRIPMVLDLDDATYVSYVSPTYGKLGSFFKFFGKTDALIKRAALVTCGNSFIADHVTEIGTAARIVPTIVDTEKFRPATKEAKIPVLGWIGTHSTFPFLRTIFPVLERLAKKHRFRLKIVGAGQGGTVPPAGVDTEYLPWDLEREIEDFQSLDIGLYPLRTSGAANMDWLMGKSGFKAIQYMAVGIPFVMSPVGVCAAIGEQNLTHFNAVTDDDWYNSLDILLSDPRLREKMGITGREHSLLHYTVGRQADILADAFRSVVKPG